MCDYCMCVCVWRKGGRENDGEIFIGTPVIKPKLYE